MVIFVRGFGSTASFTCRTSLLKKMAVLVTFLHPFVGVDVDSLHYVIVSGQKVI